MKNMKKALILVLCAVLLVAGTVAGTVAYLTHKTAAVTNTFVVGDILQADDVFELLEHEATDTDKDGVYELGTTETNENEYVVLPGVDLPKDPFVRTGKTLELDAYVFVEVVDGTCSSLTVTVDTNLWTATGLTGDHGGAVYVLKANDGIVNAGEKLDSVSILLNNKITVANETIANPGTVVFYGYMIQAAGFDDAADAAATGLGFTA